MLAMDVWCFSKSTARIDLEKHQTRLHYWGISLCNFGESPLQFWVFLLYTKHTIEKNADQRYNPTSSEEDNKRMVFLEAICEMLVNYKNLEERKHD